MFGTPGLDGKVIHLIIHQKPEALSRDSRAEAVIQSSRDRHRVSSRINYRKMRGVIRFHERTRLRMNVGVLLQLR